MAVGARHLIIALLALTASAPALALPAYSARYRMGIGNGPGNIQTGSTIGYHSFSAGSAIGKVNITVAPVAAINASVTGNDATTGVFVSAFLNYAYAVNFTATTGLVFNELNMVTVTGVASLATTFGSTIAANLNNGLITFACANGNGSDCGVSDFGFPDIADSYQEVDLLNGTSQYTLYGGLSMSARLDAAGSLINQQGQVATAQAYLDPVIGLSNSFAAANNVENVIVELSDGVANASGPPVPLPAVPEPTSWAMLVAGFGMMGTVLRRRRAMAGSVASR